MSSIINGVYVPNAQNSPKGKVNKEDLIKVLKGALIASAGAGLTYILQATSTLDFGPSTPIIVAVLSILVNFLRKINSS